MRAAGMAEESSHDHILNADTACLFALEFNKNPIVDDEAAFDLYAAPVATNSSSLPRRPPVVTIMGHVDHGKTTLLDSLRSSSVAKGEAGGITQHIGAFSVSVPKSSSASSTSPSSEEGSRSITFLDTPGHAAFSAMRARGARVTDIIVLVVAADDGVMPQTREVIQLIKRESDKIGLVVAINKVDKPGADVESVQSALWAEGIHLESMGGDIPSVEVSGLTGQGLDQLVEIISVLAEIRDVRAEENGPAQGFILESKVLRGFGNTATVLLLRGSLTAASHLICGTTHAKVRHLTDSSGNPIKRAAPGSAVIVSGWKELPQVGDEVLQGKEDEVKKALANRLRKMKIASTLNDAEVINATRRAERERKAEDGVVEEESNVMSPTGPKALRLVVKGDVSGSVEALVSAVEVIGNKDATVNVVSSGVGEVTESDVMMAKAAGGMIVAFAVPVSRLADQAAAQNGVNIYSEKIIYRVLDEVKERVIDLLPKITETRVTGEATVQQMFDIHGKGRTITRVAGCRVGNGTIHKEHRAKVFRSGVLLHDGLLDTLRILKRDVTEVKKGLECGLSFVKFDDLRERDFVQMYEVIEKPGQL
ncbi:initiation factor 2 [Schizopora paradoxa]|uniref:Translation initiation factor IF-2, mitochondrial n=1 Tax=Schizopora paradoxa TaxID=27342 RepID=A0A0H2SBA1_9AGAM|nr:initiation factor 2 [Schizopora paradoxa]